MADAKKLKRDIETLRESIRIDFQDLNQLDLTPKERAGIVHHAKWAAHELNLLVLTLEAGDDA